MVSIDKARARYARWVAACQAETTRLKATWPAEAHLYQAMHDHAVAEVRADFQRTYSCYPD